MSNTNLRFTRWNALGPWLAELLGHGFGCADVLDLPSSPQLVEADRWQCDPPTEKPRAATANVRVHVCDYFSGNCSRPVGGITARLCDKLDIDCAKPVASGIHDLGGKGDLSFDVPTTGPMGPNGFEGYLAVDSPTALCTDRVAFGDTSVEDACSIAASCNPAAPDERCRIPLYVPGLLFFNPPIVNDATLPINLPLLPSVGAVSYVMGAGTTEVATNLGSVFATIFDCDGHPASGVKLSAGNAPPQFGTIYQDNGVPVTTGQATDDTGVVGLLGVPATFTQLHAYRASDGSAAKPIASAGVIIRTSTVTYVNLVP